MPAALYGAVRINAANVPLSLDLDGDGLINVADNCPETSNPRQEDLDGERLGDACDPFPEETSNLGA